MNAKAISFTPEVLKAKLRALEEHGRCQTRRPVRSNIPSARPVANVGSHWNDGRLWVEPGGWVRSPFGAVGQRLWVREQTRVVARNYVDGVSRDPCRVTLCYEVDGHERSDIVYPARLAQPRVGHCIPNGVHREGARHFLEVVEVRAERVVGISEQDALLEGIQRFGSEWTFNGGLYLAPTAKEAFCGLWESLYGSWSSDDAWCWVYTLRRTEP